MEELLDVLRQIELCICDVSAARNAIDLIHSAMQDIVGNTGAEECTDALHIVLQFLGPVASELDNAVAAARKAARAMQ